jgi:hypothetical protein
MLEPAMIRPGDYIANFEFTHFTSQLIIFRSVVFLYIEYFNSQKNMKIFANGKATLAIGMNIAIKRAM